MTKKEMIKTIIEREEFEWELLTIMTHCYGEDDEKTLRQKRAWSTIYRLKNELGI